MCCQVTLPLTTLVPNGGIHDFPYSVKFTFQPSETVLGNMKAFQYLFCETWLFGDNDTGECFLVSPAFYNSFLVIVATNWSMTWVPIVPGFYLHIYHLKQQNNMSSLYWDKSGIVKLACTYPLYGIEMLPPPWDTTHPLIKFLSGRIFNTISVQTWDPSIHQCCHLHPLYTQP